ncbi:MAG TPA: Ku protein [Beijerinckiaceae bacterium]|nr:Ku protein [Beijerinckiaceae bacterium]
MAPPRPYWKGYLKLSLVSCPIALYAATSSSERVSFRQINRKTGNRLRQQLIDDVTREPVEPGEKGRGYEVAKNQYIFIEDDEIDAVAVESNHTIEIDRFVPRAEMDERYLDSPYYLVPDDRVGQEAFAVIRDAMRGKDMVALGRVVLAKRERVIMLQPWDKGLMGTTLRYAYEVRDTADLFSGIQDMKIAKDMLALAEHILETKAGEFDPENFHDRYEDAVVEMLRRKQAGMPAEIAKPAAPQSNVVSLMDALKKSLAAENSKAPAASGKAKKPKKKVEGQREMLLPIAGKGAGKADAAKPAAKAAPAKTGARQRKAS